MPRRTRRRSGTRISTEDSAIAVRTVAVQEEPLLARAAARAIGADGYVTRAPGVTAANAHRAPLPW